MKPTRSFVLLLALVAASSCSVDNSSACSYSYPEAEVPPGNMTTAAFFHYGNNLFTYASTTTLLNRSAEGYDAAIGNYTEAASFTLYNSDIVHGNVFLNYEGDSSETLTHHYVELRHIGDGYIHTIHEEEGWENDYRVSVENTTVNYREVFYVGMNRDYFKYFDSTHVFDDRTFRRSGTIEDNVVTLHASFVEIGETSNRWNMEVEITDDLMTRFEIHRTAYTEDLEVMSETMVETYSHTAKSDFPWGVIDWYNYHDYVER